MVSKAVSKGLSFGLTSGVITPLGLMMGLRTSTGLKLAVIGGILTVAVADALSDALGIHMSEESNKATPHKQVWHATFSAFFAKFLIALTFIIPLAFFDLATAVIINIVWGLLLLVYFNYLLAKQRGEPPLIIIRDHMLLAIAVIIVSHYLGLGIAHLFG